MSDDLLKFYNVNLDEIDDLMLKESEYIDIEKYKNNINAIRNNRIKQELQYIDLNNFIEFLNNSADKICSYIKKKNYYN